MSDNAWVPLCKRERLSILHIFAITLNQLTASLIWVPCGVLLNPMLQKLSVNNAITTILYLIGPIAGGTLCPFLGVISDNATFKLGRRRPFIFIGEVLSFVGMMFLSFADKMSNVKSVQILCLFIGQLLAMYGSNVVFSPGRALVGDVVPQTQQVLASNFCIAQQGLAGILSNLFGAVKLADKFSGNAFGYEQFVLLVTSIIGLIALAISCIVSPEERLMEKRAVGNPLVSMWNVIKLFNFNMWMVGLGFLFFAAGTNQANTWLATFMAKTVFGGSPDSTNATIAEGDKSYYDLYNDGVAFSQQLGVYQTIFQVLFGLTGHMLSNKIGLKWTWVFSMTIGLIGCVLLNFNYGKKNRYVYIFPYVFLAFALMTGNSVPMAIVSLYLDAEQMGGAQGVMNIFNCTGQLMVMFILQLGFGTLANNLWNQGKSGFHYGNIVGLGSVFLFIANITGYIGISRAMKDSVPRLDDDVEPPKIKEDVPSLSI